MEKVLLTKMICLSYRLWSNKLSRYSKQINNYQHERCNIRIISKFRDYYDSGMTHGIDMTRIFYRETKEIKGSFPLPYYTNIFTEKCDSNSVPQIRLTGGRFSYPYIISYGVLFAGKYYPGIEVGVDHLSESQRFYTLESFLKHINDVGLADFLISKRDSDGVKFKALFKHTGSEALREYAINNKISIATDWNDTLIYGEPTKLVFNPSLRNLQFQKIVDPMAAFQELDMWVCGVLTESDPPNFVPDKQKIINHGFDPKLSFRKSKE